MKNAVIFDLDGVLIDSEPIHYKNVMEYLRKRGVHPNKVDFNDYIGRSNEESWDMLITDPVMRQSLYEGYYAYLERDPIDYREALNQGVKSLLNFLSEEGYSIGLASAGPYDEIQRVLHQCGIYQFFGVVISGEMCRYNKPAPDVYIKALELMKVDREDALVIEDSKNGIHAAKTAGIETWAISHTDYEVDQSEADRVVTGMHDILINLKTGQSSTVDG